MPAVSAKLWVSVGSSRSVISPASTPWPARRPRTSRSAGSLACAAAHVCLTNARIAPGWAEKLGAPVDTESYTRKVRDVDETARRGLGEHDLLQVGRQLRPVGGCRGQLIRPCFDIPRQSQHGGGTVHGVDPPVLLEPAGQELQCSQKFRIQRVAGPRL